MQTEASSFSLRAAIAGSIVTVVTVLTLSMVLGVLFFLSDAAERSQSLFALMAMAAAYLVGGTWAAARAGRRGWLHGLVSGLLVLGPHLWLARGLGEGLPGGGWLQAGLALLGALLGGMTGVQFHRGE